MNSNVQRRSAPGRLRFLAAALLALFAFTLLAAPSILAPRNCPMPCCKISTAKVVKASNAPCQTRCGISQNTAKAEPLPQSVQTSVSTSTHAMATVVAIVSPHARNEVAPASVVISPHPHDAPLHVLNSVFLI